MRTESKLSHWLLLSLCLCLMLALSSCSVFRHSVKNRSKKSDHTKTEREIERAAEKELKGDQKKIVEEAFEWYGTPYAYGHQEKGRSTDCSGFVMKVFESTIGCKLPRNSAKQAEFCHHIGKHQVKAGDLIFFITNGGSKINHVGIMIDDKQFIHASTHGVRVDSIEKEYYRKHFQRFGRVPCLHN